MDSYSMSFFAGPKSCIGYTLAILEMNESRLPLALKGHDLTLFVETALAELLPSFSFAPPEQDEIVWRFGITISASVKGEKSFNPTMPVRLTQLDTAAF